MTKIKNKLISLLLVLTILISSMCFQYDVVKASNTVDDLLKEYAEKFTYLGASNTVYHGYVEKEPYRKYFCKNVFPIAPIGYRIDDYDQDGQKELLIVTMDEELRAKLEMYEVENNRVIMKDSSVFVSYQYAEYIDYVRAGVYWEDDEFSCFTYNYKGEKIIALEAYFALHISGDGAGYDYVMVRYDGNKLSIVNESHGGGSNFSVEDINYTNEEFKKMDIILDDATNIFNGSEKASDHIDNKIIFASAKTKAKENAWEIINNSNKNRVDNISDITFTMQNTGVVIFDSTLVSIWNNFLKSKEYVQYTNNYLETSLEYAINDINSDNIPELLIQSSLDRPFYNTWLFALDGKKIVVVEEKYGYVSFRYSQSFCAVIVSPETKPTAETGSWSFYSLEGTKLKYKFQVGIDGGRSYYSDSAGNKNNISEDERNSYFKDVENFEWKSIQSLESDLDSEPLEFTIGRDNNLFEHSESSFFSGTKKDYSIQSLSFRNALYKEQDVSHRNLLSGKEHKNWGGSCYGISTSMMYAYHKGYAIDQFLSEENKDYPYYAVMERPVSNSKVKDLIQIFQLSQFRSDATYTDSANNSFVYKKFGIGNDIKVLLKGIVDEAEKSNYQNPFLLGIVYKGGGHALVVCGSDGVNNGYYKIAICDPNGSPIFDEKGEIIGSRHEEYIYLMIKKDYSDFHMENKDGKVLYSNKIDADNFKELKYVTYEDAYSKVANRKMDNCEVIVDVDSSFYMSADNGQYLSYDGEEFTGNMEIDDVSSVINASNGDESASWIIKLSDVNKIDFSNLSSAIEIDCLFDSDEYANVDGDRLTAVSFEDDKGVSIEGKDADYTISISAKDKEHTLMQADGRVKDKVTFQYEGENIAVDGVQNATDISMNKITDEGIKALEPLKDPVFDIDEKKHPSVIGLTLNQSSLSMKVNETYKLIASVMPSDGIDDTPSWSSSNPGIVSVLSNGQIKAISEGIARITASIDNISATCIVTVSSTDNGGVNNYTVTFDPQGGTSVSAQTVQENHSLTYIPATYKNGYQFIGWYTGINGAGSQLTAETKISHSAVYYAYWIPIQANPDNSNNLPVNISGTNSVIVMVENCPELTFIQANVQTGLYESLLGYYPYKKGYSFCGWYLDENLQRPVEKSSVLQNGMKVYAKWEKLYNWKLNKKKIILKVGKSCSLRVIGLAGNKVKWKSLNKKIATVSSNGKIKAKRPGKTKIIAITKDGSVMGCTVIVKKKK